MAAAILAAGLVSCAKDTNTKEAVRQAVIDHLATRKNLDLDLSAMDVDVTSVSFRANEADAQVAFRPRGSQNAAALMQMRYTLERAGNQWKVKSKADSGGSPHGSAPPPTTREAPSPQPSLPAGHPPLDPGARKSATPGSEAPRQ